MKEFIEFRPLERLSGQPAEFLAFLDAQIKEHGIEHATNLLRLSGICVDIYGTGKYTELLEDAKRLISSYDGEHNKFLTKLSQDVNLFEAVFDSFRELRSSTGVTEIPLDRQISAFLLTAEMFLGSLTAYAQLKNIDDIQKVYPFVIGFADNNSNFVSPEKVLGKIIQLFDNVMEQLGLILKYLYFTGASFVGLHSTIKIDEIISSRDHIQLFDRYDVIYKKYEYWRFFDGNLVTPKETIIYFSPTVETDLISQRIGTFRARIRRNKWMQEFRLVMEKVPTDPATKQLPKTGYRLPEEFLSSIFCHDYFGSDDLSEKILEISLAEWIRAYTILSQVSTQFLTERKSMKPFALSEWCLAKTEQEWVSVFETNGITQNNAKTIVKSLIFDKNAKDLIDCPFIPIDGYLILGLAPEKWTQKKS
jgi:hypothetical protein